MFKIETVGMGVVFHDRRIKNNKYCNDTDKDKIKKKNMVLDFPNKNDI